MAESGTANKAYLLSPKTDWLTVGGLSVLLLPIFMLIPFDDADTEQFGWILYAIAFLVNYPHFTVSYQLLYQDYGKKIFSDYRFLWAAVIVPILMVAYIAWWFSSPSPEGLAYFVEFMFVIVGWHYTKQCYGAVMVTSSMNKYFYNKWERGFLKFNMYSLWLTSLAAFNGGYKDDFDYWGIKFSSLNLPKELVYIGYGLTAISLMGIGVLFLKRIIQTKKWPPLITFASFFSIYAWYLPVLFHPAYFLAVPFFHSIQYFTFVYALKRNEWRAEEKQPNKRWRFFWIFTAIALVTGALFFEGIPRVLDFAVSYDEGLYGDALFLFLFSVFLNIHHYFIDNVIWRADNKHVKEHLFIH